MSDRLPSWIEFLSDPDGLYSRIFWTLTQVLIFQPDTITTAQNECTVARTAVSLKWTSFLE